MSREIREYKLEVQDSQYILLPEYSEILGIQAKGNDIVLYAEVKVEKNKMRKHTILMQRTGDRFDGTLPFYLDTVQLNGEMLHFYDL